MPTCVCKSRFMSVHLYIYSKILLKLTITDTIVMHDINAILNLLQRWHFQWMTFSVCGHCVLDCLCVQKGILSEETVIWYGYDDHVEWNVLIYVVVNKLCFTKDGSSLCFTSWKISRPLLTICPVKWMVKSFSVPEYNSIIETPTVTWILRIIWFQAAWRTDE